jgi:C1A family cysteine protease
MHQFGESYILSPEQITQCASLAYGCSGGWTEVAYEYVKKAGGLQLDADYPYTSYNGVTGTCSADKTKEVINVVQFKTLSTEEDMASYIQYTSPLSICVDANNWNSYTGGVMSVCGQSVDHCVQLVGVDMDQAYWKVRNSWGTSWGESGFIRLAYGQNTCDITHDPSLVVVEKVNA